MDHLSLSLFGDFNAVNDDQPLANFRTRKVQALLIYLVDQPGPHRRESLTDLLWPGMPKRSARQNLRQILYNLRQEIPQVSANASTGRKERSSILEPVPFLITNRHSIQLNPQAKVESDVKRFSTLLARAQEHGHTDLLTCHQCRQDLQDAVTLYRGDFLADFFLDDSDTFEEWAETRRQTYRRRMLDSLESLATIFIHQKAYPEARHYARRQLEIDDLRESSYRQLMKILALEGRREQALSVYDTCRKQLAEELGMAPTKRTTELYEKIAAGDLSLATDQEKGVRGYQLKEEIGQGSYGKIYRALQPAVKRDVAIKVIRRKFANDPQFIRRFEAEAQTIAHLEHPYIVPLYDYWREPEGAYLVMRLFRGGNLLNSLEAGPWELEPTVQLLDQVSSALATAHRQGVVHRDIKPANILFDESGNAYLSDFGIAKDLTQELNLTVEGAFIGTPDYTSPEQLRNEPLTTQADIYSLGAVLYETLTGERPYGDSSLAMRIQKKLVEPIPFVRASRPDLPAAVDDVIQKATAKRPQERYPDALAMAEAFRHVVRGQRTGYAALPTAVPAGIEIANPYKGLRAFQENDASDFFGRELLTQQLITRLGDSSFLAVIGPSGSGKSSLVKAGLIPELRGGALPNSDKWFIAEMVPGAHPLQELEQALLPIAVDPPPNLIEPMQKDERGMLRTIRRILPSEHDAHLLLLIDQFEELFTLIDDQKRRSHFINSLLMALNSPRSPLHVVVTLRADFYDRPLNTPALAELFKHNTEIILPLTREELAWAIGEPARQMGVKIDESVVTGMVADVEGQPGALPLLQYALTELFEDRQDGLMTLTAYEDLGGVSGALARRAEDLFNSFDPDQQEMVRQIFLRLVTLGQGVEDTRRRVLLSELGAIQTSEVFDTSEVLDQFGRYRLLTFDNDPITREPTVEVAHEALLREWPKLRGWLEESRDDVRLQRLLAIAAAEWAASSQDAGFLLRGSRLDLFENWAEEMDLALTGEEQAFLQESIDARREREAEEEARRRQELQTARKLAATEKARAEEQEQAAGHLRRRALFLTGALAIAALLAIAAIFFANQSNANAQTAVAEADQRATAQAIAEEQQNVAENEAESRATAQAAAEASEQEAIAQQATAEAEANFRATAEAQAIADRNRAEEQSKLATSRELAAAALQNIVEDPELSILLALEALNNAHTIEAESALHTAIQNSALRKTFSHDSDIRTAFVTINPESNQFFASGRNGGIMWDMEAGEVLYSIETDEGNWINEAGFTPDGTMLILPHENYEDGNPAPSPVTIVEAATGQEILSFNPNQGPVQIAEVSPDGRLLVTQSFDQGLAAKVWDLQATVAQGTGQLVHELCCSFGGNAKVAFSIDGSRLATINRDDSAEDGKELVRIWDLATGENLASMEAERPMDTAFSPDGNFIAAASEGFIEIWDTVTGEMVSSKSVDFGPPLRAIHFTPDGDYLIITSRLGNSSLWRFSEGNVQIVKEYRGHTANTFDSDLTADGRHLLTISPGDGTARLWSLNPHAAVELGALSQEGILTDIKLYNDGSQLATSNLVGVLKIWDLTHGEELMSIQAHDDAINGLSVSPDGQTIATGGRDEGPIKLWNAENGALLQTLEGHEFEPSHYYRNIINLQFSSDGKYLASIGADNRAIVWDGKTGERLTTINGHDGESLAFSPDSRFLATASWEGTISLWDSTTGKEMLQFSDDSEAAYTNLAVSPEGQHLLATRGNKKAELWRLPVDLWSDDPGQAVLIETIETVNSIPGYIAFSPDGQKIAMSGDRLVVEVRHFPSLDLQFTLQFRPGGACPAFTPDSKVLITCGKDGIIRFFTADYDELLSLAHERVTRDLTEEECRRFLHIEACPRGENQG